MKLSAYPTLTTDYQRVTENYPTLEPTLEPTLYPTLNKGKFCPIGSIGQNFDYSLFLIKVYGLGIENLWFRSSKHGIYYQ